MIGGDEEAVKRNTGLMRPNDIRRWITLYNKVWGDSPDMISLLPGAFRASKNPDCGKRLMVAVSPLLLWDKSRLVALPTFSTPNMA